MATVTIRNLPDAVHTAIRVRAAHNGRSTEAEIRHILAESVEQPGRLRVGTELRRYAQSIGFAELDLPRDPAPIEPASFE
jgi:antitoxin FitA